MCILTHRLLPNLWPSCRPLPCPCSGVSGAAAAGGLCAGQHERGGKQVWGGAAGLPGAGPPHPRAVPAPAAGGADDDRHARCGCAAAGVPCVGVLVDLCVCVWGGGSMCVACLCCISMPSLLVPMPPPRPRRLHLAARELPVPGRLPAGGVCRAGAAGRRPGAQVGGLGGFASYPLAAATSASHRSHLHWCLQPCSASFPNAPPSTTPIPTTTSTCVAFLPPALPPPAAASCCAAWA